MRYLLIILLFIAGEAGAQMPLFHAHNTGCMDGDVQRFYDSTGITDATQKQAICELVAALKANNLWAKLEVIYPFVGGTSAAHAFNLKSSSYNMTWVNAPTHNSTGVTFDGSTQYGNTNYLASNLKLLGTYNTSIGVYGNPIGTTDNNFGAFTGGGFSAAYGAFTTTTLFSGLYYFDAFNDVTYTGSGFNGLLHIQRVAVADATIFLNGSAVATETGSSNFNNAGLGAINMYFGALNHPTGGGAIAHYEGDMRFAWIGQSFTTGDAATLYSIIQAYQTKLSRQL